MWSDFSWKKFTNPLSGYEFEGLTLPYGGVLESHRERGIFSGLLSEAKASKTPLQIDVSHANKSGMAARLLKKGFVKKSLVANQDYFVWTPQ
jgi:hypothetical protein